MSLLPCNLQWLKIMSEEDGIKFSGKKEKERKKEKTQTHRIYFNLVLSRLKGDQHTWAYSLPHAWPSLQSLGTRRELPWPALHVQAKPPWMSALFWKTTADKVYLWNMEHRFGFTVPLLSFALPKVWQGTHQSSRAAQTCPCSTPAPSQSNTNSAKAIQGAFGITDALQQFVVSRRFRELVK